MVYLDNTTQEQTVYIPREGFLAGGNSGGNRYFPGDNISISPSNVISVTGMTEAISAATSDFVTSGDVHSQIEEETSDFVNSEALSAYTQTSGFTTINNNTITEGGNITIYAPASAGTSGELLVSSGSGAPIWKTIAQALGIDFWTGAQSEYDLIPTKSATTLYIIIPE